jgi:hypothetical protein
MIRRAEYENPQRPRCGSLRWLLVGATLVGIGIALGSVVAPPSMAVGQVRTPALREHIQSGGQLSLPLLQEISATLRQIDARLARLEAVAKQLRPQRVPAPAQ